MAWLCETRDTSSRHSIINGFLKNWVYIFMRYRTMAKMHNQISSGWTDTTLYSKFIGTDKWIDKFHTFIGAEDGQTSNAHITEIQKLPLELEPEERDYWPWESDHTLWEELSVGIPEKKGDITTLLYAFERASEGDTSPTMSRLHMPSKPQLEHVLPENPSKWGLAWYKNGKPTSQHEKWVGSLGNHVILEDSKNSHVGNFTLDVKVPTGGCNPCPTGKEHNHYQDTAYKSAKLIIEHHEDGGNWNVGAMKKHSKLIMNTIVEFFNGC